MDYDQDYMGSDQMGCNPACLLLLAGYVLLAAIVWLFVR